MRVDEVSSSVTVAIALDGRSATRSRVSPLLARTIGQAGRGVHLAATRRAILSCPVPGEPAAR